MTRRHLTGIWIAAAACVLLGASRAPIYVGVLEAPLQVGISQQFHVRVAFRFQDGRWSAMPQNADDEETLAKLAELFPAEVSWTIASRGRKLGRVTSVRPADYSSYSDAGFEDLTASSKPPAIEDNVAPFETWRGVPSNRPLLAVSEPNYRDPDQWKQIDASVKIGKQAVAAFRQEIALDLNCDGTSTRGYPDSAIQIFDKPYKSAGGDLLIAMRPDPRLNHCSGPVGDEWRSAWFHLKGDQYRWIGNGLTLLDIGDYNGGGVAEVLFQYDGYDRDGYVLLSPRDDSKTEFSWTYH